ncbi:hypothetical protein F2Q70_00007018 [Brassica cretica]|uniref:Uncharacterized protein n=1 Tax=Brassica cretica TaxID=69181 RepID=A0A8S9MAY8_BRACR|nr:hypothetical protein F2Q70_00007018 [Brassica cretica]KAF3551697.1 hypothetical protein DY000_02000062 [Brassica cretica]
MESVSTVPELRWDKLIVGVAAPRVSCLGEKLLGRTQQQKEYIRQTYHKAE